MNADQHRLTQIDADKGQSRFGFEFSSIRLCSRKPIANGLLFGSGGKEFGSADETRVKLSQNLGAKG